MSTASAAPRQLPVWAIILTAGVIVGMAMGLRQVMGLYLQPMTTELGIGREPFSNSMAIANLVWGVGSIIAGAVADKFGAGRVIVASVLATFAGLYVMYAATSPMDLYLSGVLLGIGVCGTGMSALVGAVGRAVPAEKRTAAIASLGMAAGIGGFVAFPYTHLLIEWLGWQSSLLVLAGTALVMLPLAYGLSGKPVTQQGQAKPQSLMGAFREAFNHPSFWLLTAGFFVCGFHVAFYSVHLPAFVVDKGLDASVGVVALMAVGIANIVGTYIAGQSARVVERRVGLAFIYFMRCFAFLGLLFLPISGPMVVFVSALLGLFWLSTVPLTSSLVAIFFGTTWMSMLFGFVFLSHQVGSFLGLWMAGRLYDMTGSYDAMWWISVALGLFAAAVHLPIREKPVARLAEPSVVAAS